MKLMLLSIGLLGLAFAGIAIKILVKKEGKFAGTCASNNPILNEDGSLVVFAVHFLISNVRKRVNSIEFPVFLLIP